MWEINNYDQVITFLLSCGLGAICCFVYDIIRSMRKVCLNSFFAITITDVLLWIFYAFITFVFMVATTKGEIRGYVIFGEFLGFVLFRISISKLLMPLLSFIFIKIAAISSAICKITDSFYMKFETIILKMIAYAFKILKSVKKLLKNASRLLYTDKNNESAENIRNETKTEA